MIQIQYPRSDIKRLLLLEQAIATATQDQAAGRDYVSARWVSEAQALVPDFGAKVRSMSALKGHRGQDIIEKNETMAELVRYVRDFWSGLKRRIIRLKQPNSLFLLYNLPQTGRNPTENNTSLVWLERGAGLIAADAKAVERGYPPMSNPSAAELQVVLDRARAEFGDVAMAHREVDVAQHEVNQLRPRADRLIRLLSAQLNASLYELPAEGIRHVKGTYGFEFYTLPEKLQIANGE